MPRTADWFSNLSKKAQAEYLKAHPNSKYGKAKAPAVKARGTITAANIAKIKDKKPNPAGAMMVKLADIELKHFRQKDPVKKAALKTQMVALKAKIKKVLAESKTVSKVAAKGTAHEVKRAADKNKVVAKTPSARKPVKKVMVSLTDFLANKRKAVDSKVKYARTQIEKLEAQIAKGTLTAVQKSAIRTKIKGLNERIKELKKPPAASKPSLSKISIRQKAMKK